MLTTVAALLFLFVTTADPHTLQMFSDLLIQPEESQEDMLTHCLVIGAPFHCTCL